MSKVNAIKPLFIVTDNAIGVGRHLLQINSDDYNKAIGEQLIDAKTDAEAIAAFLAEYQTSPETFRSYCKEIERLLLWCIILLIKTFPVFAAMTY